MEPYSDEPYSDDPEDAALEQAITAASLLDTIVYLCAKACELAAQADARDEWEQHADYVALCLSRPAQTRMLARDFMAVVSANARRRVGADFDGTSEEFVVALRLVGDFEARVLERMPVIA
jgi:hypothetical protein